MGKYGVFAFGANESSACMCLCQKMFQMRRDQFPAQDRLHSGEEKRRNTHSLDPGAFLDKPSVVFGYGLDFVVLFYTRRRFRPFSPVRSCWPISLHNNAKN